MEGFKGTRGPWVASKTDRSIGPISKDDDQSYGMILPVAWVEFNGKPEHQVADANLIAAAPELLQALQELCRGWDEKGGISLQDILNGRAAIEKALGK